MRNIAVIGLGGFGSTVACELTRQGAQVIAIDRDRERVEALKDLVTYAVGLDASDGKALQAVGLDQVDVAVVCIGEDVEGNLLTTLLLKKMGVKRIWSRAISDLQQEILRILEVDQIINLEEQMGRTVARSLASATISKYVELGPGHSIAEIPIPASFVGKTLLEIDPRGTYGVNVVAVKVLTPAITDTGERQLVERLDTAPSPKQRLPEECVLLVAGPDREIDRFSRG
jgi:trk system potassium uptake protein